MKLLARLFGFLILAASLVLAGMLFTGIIPTFVADALESALCEADEAINTESGNTVVCVDAESGARSDITGTVIGVAIGILLIGGFIGMLLVVRFSPPRDPSLLSNKFDKFASERNLQRVHQHMTTEEKRALQDLTAKQGQGDLSSRLKQLKDAYDQGLISQSEYEKARQDALET